MSNLCPRYGALTAGEARGEGGDCYQATLSWSGMSWSEGRDHHHQTVRVVLNNTHGTVSRQLKIAILPSRSAAFLVRLFNVEMFTYVLGLWEYLGLYTARRHPSHPPPLVPRHVYSSKKQK